MSPVRPRNQSASQSRRWRECAEEARRWAEGFTDPTARRLMRGIAERYDLLAEHFDHASDDLKVAPKRADER